jgi:hypothetical protein
MHKEITITVFVDDAIAHRLAFNIQEDIKAMNVSYIHDVKVEKPTKRLYSIHQSISDSIEKRYPIGTAVKISKKGLIQNIYYKRPKLEPGTEGEVTDIDGLSVMPFQVKFENGKTIYCSVAEIEEA